MRPGIVSGNFYKAFKERRRSVCLPVHYNLCRQLHKAGILFSMQLVATTTLQASAKQYTGHRRASGTTKLSTGSAISSVIQC
ncbi:hypothetical protein GDO81_011198 [Engystomops pustulosus]|uniref:Uncharacterized protein n=1 Tax=Engystomops pustulosus TaxID=76066 RepID=A0AAV7BCW3_ENGPU|nr:hypothetical protein GDO81_011198 [Engystomops pustulosus]KAG8570292.1 hypothetical protein GDO81_011198 [Engystomops pustulosus]